VREYANFTETTLRGQAAGLGVTYEDMAGDYTELPFSAARMSRLRIWARVDDTRWRMLVPQFCDPVWKWAMLAGTIAGLGPAPAIRWSAPPMPMIEPDKEGLAYQRNVRGSIMSLSEAIRERGYDPEELLDEIAADNKRLDELGIVSDSDARVMTQAGQLQGKAAAPATERPRPPAVEDDEEAERRVWVGRRR
jgi:capsid protein